LEQNESRTWLKASDTRTGIHELERDGRPRGRMTRVCALGAPPEPEEVVVSGKIEPKSHKEIDEALKEEWLRRALGLPEGQRPLPWQLDLLDRVLRGAAVQALDIPTGLGKTATMAIWLVARALGASLPRRLVYVVDRRAVVDQATEIAEHLREWVANEPPIAEALGLGDRRLPISTLR